MSGKRIENGPLIKGVKLAESNKQTQLMKVVYNSKVTHEEAIHNAITSCHFVVLIELIVVSIRRVIHRHSFTICLLLFSCLLIFSQEDITFVKGQVIEIDKEVNHISIYGANIY